MQKTLLLKAVTLAALYALLMIPLQMIGGVVTERAARQQAVARDLAATSYGPQTLAGPILTLPYVEEYDETVGDGASRRVERRSVEHALHLFPRTNALAGDATIETKARGPFRVRVYTWRAKMRGEFVIDGAVKLARARPDSRLALGAPVLSVLLADPRGLAATPTLEWDGQPIAFERGSALARSPSGVHAELPPLERGGVSRIAYSIDIGLHGTQSLAIVPLADDDRTTIHSAWPHPSFAGHFLPEPSATSVRDDGFEAQWTVSSLASNAQSQLRAVLEGASKCAQPACADGVEVRFVEPIDVYSLSDRALKYGFLFIGLTFGCFALMELMLPLRIHPAQYLLVGLALATFILLLLALSEHVAFAVAYAAAAAACVALLGYYLAAVLGATRRALACVALFASLYASLYALLASEDNALLLGSLLVFALLAAAMTLTRRFDWYALRPLGERREPVDATGGR
jgi:inner membrane protein